MSMTINEAMQVMDLNFRAGITTMFKGPPGCGKSDTAHQYAEKQGPDYGLMELNAATANLPDIIGIQMPQTERHTNVMGETQELLCGRFSYPYFLRDKRTGRPALTFSRCMVLIEEYGQATPDVKRGLAQVIWEKRIGEYVFPEHTDILILSNRSEDRSGVTKDFDFMINRRSEINVRPELDPWLIWAHERKVSLTSLAFASRNEDKVFNPKVPEKQGPWLTPRSLVSTDKFLQEAQADKMPLDHPIVRENIAGLIGEGNAHIYIAFAKIRDELPPFSAILNDPRGCPIPSAPDQQMFLVFDMASKVTKTNMDAVITYLDRMHADFSIAFYRSACLRDESLRSTKAFGDWAVRNVQLLSAISSKI